MFIILVVINIQLIICLLPYKDGGRKSLELVVLVIEFTTTFIYFSFEPHLIIC